MSLTALLIVSAVVLFILLLVFAILMLRCNVTLEYRDELSLHVSVLGIEKLRFPKKRKPIDLSRYTPKELEKRRRKKERKKAKKKKMLLRLLEKIGAKDAEPTKDGLLGEIGQIYDLVKILLSRCIKHARLKAKRIIINVSTDDAAKTAILFGAVNQTVIALVEFLDQAKRWSGLHKSEIAVRADFTSGKSTADIHIVLSLRIWQIVDILFHPALQ